jgi:hypothetical protein
MSKNQYNPDRVSRPSESFCEARDDFGDDHFIPVGFAINRSRQYENLIEARVEELEAENAELRAAIAAFVDVFKVESGFHEGHFQLSVRPNVMTGFRGSRGEALKRLIDLSKVEK